MWQNVQTGEGLKLLQQIVIINHKESGYPCEGTRWSWIAS